MNLHSFKCPDLKELFTQNNLTSLAKWLRVCFRTEWLWVRVPLQELKLGRFCILMKLSFACHNIIVFRHHGFIQTLSMSTRFCPKMFLSDLIERQSAFDFLQNCLEPLALI